MKTASRRAVFLDRDGVLNEPVIQQGRPYPPASMDELKVAEDAPAALHRLKDAGFLLIVVTNQPDVARGKQTREMVERINMALATQLPIDAFCVCWHDDRDACECRKPRPGLMLDASVRYGIDLVASYLIGDRWRDIDAGASAGCRTVLIDRHYQERKPQVEPNQRVASLAAAAEWILTDITLRP
jgi:D-glycero-D-manno-heptose 1,7-bisphosphate phosphatase